MIENYYDLACPQCGRRKNHRGVRFTPAGLRAHQKTHKPPAISRTMTYRDLLSWAGIHSHGLFCKCTACERFVEDCHAAGTAWNVELRCDGNTYKLDRWD